MSVNNESSDMKQMSKKVKQKKEILESKGYSVGSADEFLGLSKEESQYIELKLSLFILNEAAEGQEEHPG